MRINLDYVQHVHDVQVRYLINVLIYPLPLIFSELNIPWKPGHHGHVDVKLHG
jgi:hypothetical protein